MREYFPEEGKLFTVFGRIEGSRLYIGDLLFVQLDDKYVQGSGYFLLLRVGFYTKVLNALYV